VLRNGERLRISNQLDAADAAAGAGRSTQMIHLPASVRVYLCLSPIDMRRSFENQANRQRYAELACAHGDGTQQGSE